MSGDFKPEPFYDSLTDSLMIYFKDEPSYATVISDNVTLFVSDTNVVGIEISGISKMISTNYQKKNWENAKKLGGVHGF